MPRFETQPTIRRILLGLMVTPTMLAAQTRPAAGQYINPAGLAPPTGFTQVIVAPAGRTVYIAGQVAFDSAGRVVGPGDFRAQAERVFANLDLALRGAGVTFADVVKTTTFVTDLSQLAVLREVREVRARYLDAARPPASTVVEVKSLVRPELLIEIEAVAVLPEARRP
ncbi:MAG: RidA family protein [Gemmatimonadales bacterium]